MNLVARLPNRQRGYSLIELLVTLFLIGLLLLGAGTSIRNAMPRWQLERTARAVASALKGARAEAIITGARQTLAFDTANRRYAVLRGPFPQGLVLVINGGQTTRIATLPANIAFREPDNALAVTFVRAGV